MKRGDSCMTDLEGFDGKIKEHFKDKILKEIIDEAKDYMTYTLVKEVNKELYDYGTHYKVGGGFDFNDFYSTQYGDSLRRGSKTVQRANKYVS